MQRVEVDCNNFATFCSRFHTLTHGLAEAIANTEGMVFAGGSVVGTLTNGDVGDVDIFLICELGEATTALTRVYDALRSLGSESKEHPCRLLVTRSRHAVSMFRICDGKPLGLAVQVILSVYKSVGHLLSSFDIDCCAV